MDEKTKTEKIQFYYYEDSKGQFFIDDKFFDLGNINIPKDAKITNLIATDINKDGIIDLVVTFLYERVKYQTNFYLGAKEFDSLQTKFESIYNLSNTQFFMADLNGDLRLKNIFFNL